MLPRQTSTRTNSLWLLAPLLLAVSCIDLLNLEEDDFGFEDLAGYWDTTVSFGNDDYEVILEFSSDGTELIDIHNNDGVGTTESYGEFIASRGGNSSGSTSVSSTGDVEVYFYADYELEDLDTGESFYYEEMTHLTGVMNDSKTIINGFLDIEWIQSEFPGGDSTEVVEGGGACLATKSDGNGFGGDGKGLDDVRNGFGGGDSVAGEGE